MGRDARGAAGPADGWRNACAQGRPHSRRQVRRVAPAERERPRRQRLGSTGVPRTACAFKLGFIERIDTHDMARKAPRQMQNCARRPPSRDVGRQLAPGRAGSGSHRDCLRDIAGEGLGSGMTGSSAGAPAAARGDRADARSVVGRASSAQGFFSCFLASLARCETTPLRHVASSTVRFLADVPNQRQWSICSCFAQPIFNVLMPTAWAGNRRA